MTKYNITEKKEKEAKYRTLVSPMLMDELKEKILNVIVNQIMPHKVWTTNFILPRGNIYYFYAFTMLNFGFYGFD